MELKQAIGFINHKSILVDRRAAWADLGCGNGLFTLALTHVLHKGSRIYAVDKNKAALNQLQGSLNDTTIEKIPADFVKEPLPLIDLDGLLMANSFHFVKEKIPFIHKAQKWLKEGGQFLIIEYNTDSANPWVPYPISFSALVQLFKKAGYDSIEMINEMPSLLNRATIYSVLIRR